MTCEKLSLMCTRSHKGSVNPLYFGSSGERGGGGGGVMVVVVAVEVVLTQKSVGRIKRILIKTGFRVLKTRTAPPTKETLQCIYKCIYIL